MADTTENADKATRTGVSDIRQAVETANAEDERSKKDSSDDEDDDDDSDDESEGDDDGAEGSEKTEDSDDAEESDEDEDESEDEDNPDDKKSQTKRHYDQYKGDGTDKSYISNLEKAHQSSITEAVSLKQQLNQATSRTDAILRAAAADPELATKLNAVINGAGTDDGEGDGADKGSNVAENPFVKDLQAQWTKKSEEEIDKFIEANPEVASDPKIKADVQHWMGIFSNEHFTRTGRLLSGGEAMTQAYKHLGLENKLEKQNLAAGAKKIVAPSRPRGKVKKSTGQKQSFTPDQLAMAKAMGKDENWLAKNAK